MRGFVSISAIALTLVCMVWSPSAEAHDLPVERSLVLQMHSSHAELLLVYSEPPGPRTDRLLALYDQDENGKIDGAEGALAKRPMLRRAFLGLDLQFEEVTIGKKQPRVRYKRDRAGGIAVAIYQRIDFVNPTNELELIAALEDTRGVPDLKLVVELAGRWTFVESDADEMKVTLAAGGQKKFELRRKPVPANDVKPQRNWQPPEQIRP